MLDFFLGAGPLYWLRIAALGGLLAFVIIKARWRWQDGAAADAAKRLFYPWLVLVTGCALYLGLFTIILAPVLIFYLVAILAVWVVGPALVSVGLLEIGGRLAGAERTGFWLGAAIIACLAMTIIWLGIFGLGAFLTIPQLWLEYLALATVPTAAAICWWGFLPGISGAGEVSKTFD